MKLKNLISLLIFLIAMAAIGVFLFFHKNFTTTVLAPSQLTVIVQDKQIADSTNPFKITVNYPQIAGLDNFNQKAKAIVDKELNNFKTNSLENDAAVKATDPVDYAKYPREYDLDIGYTKGEIDQNIASIIFEEYNFEGGAHGATIFIPLNYDIKSKQEIKLADLFPNQKDYLKTISDFCIKDLTKQITDKLGSTDGTWIQDGAGPAEENYSTFLINKNNIVFYFPQYQVAYGAAGDFEVTFPR